MKKALFVFIPVLLIVGLFALPVMADTLVKFEGGIGVDPVSGVAGEPTPPATGDARRNDVRGVQPGSQPWVISKLEAEVKVNGDIHVRGDGLLHAGGDRIGRTAMAIGGVPGGVSVVAATLFCGSVPGFSSHSSGTFTLEPNGDFEIRDTLSNLPLPDPCDNPVLLIRANSNTGRWIAAGIPKLD